MPRYIVKLTHEGKDYYLDWSTIVDAPVTYGMSLEEFKAYYHDEYGRKECELGLRERLKRVEAKGTSARDECGSLKMLLRTNRAGDNEECLSEEEVIQKYCLERPSAVEETAHPSGIAARAKARGFEGICTTCEHLVPNERDTKTHWPWWCKLRSFATERDHSCEEWARFVPKRYSGDDDDE